MGARRVASREGKTVPDDSAGARRSICVAALAVLLVAVDGCGPTEPSDSSVAGAMARQWCPASAMTECTAAVKAAVAAGQPAAVCVYPDSRWEITTPSPQDTTGSACGATGTGTLRGVIVPNM